MSVKVKYGTGFKWGTSWKYGFGTSEPWKPRTGAARFNVESLTDTAVELTQDFSSLMFFTPQGELSIKYPGYADEVFYLISPDLTSWRITNSGTTGAQTIDSGFTGTPIGIGVVDRVGAIWRASISNLGEMTLTNQANGLTIEVNSIPTYTTETP